MISLSLRTKTIKIHKKKFLAQIKQSSKEATIEGAKEFVLVVKSIVPVYTGMAHGSLAALGSAVGIHWSVSPSVRTDNSSPTGTRRLESRFNEGYNLADFGLTESKGLTRYYFKSYVEHLNINDQIDPSIYGIYLRSNAPWRAFAQGKEAALNKVREYLNKNNPRMRDFIRLSGTAYHSPRIEVN